MAFKLNPTRKFTRQVTVSHPGEKKQTKGSFTVVYNLLPINERKRIFDEEGLDGLLEAITDEIKDIEVPEGFDVRETVLNDQPCRGAILAKYNEEVDGVERKNLKI